MPCTNPMIPHHDLLLHQAADEKGGNALLLASVYGLGIVLMFVLLGVLAGPLLVPFATHYVTNLFIGVLFVVFALALFGAITLKPRPSSSWVPRARPAARRDLRGLPHGPDPGDHELHLHRSPSSAP